VPRRDLILVAAAPEDLLEPMANLGQVRVVPLMQALLHNV
jgi:hypothetical protein